MRKIIMESTLTKLVRSTIVGVTLAGATLMVQDIIRNKDSNPEGITKVGKVGYAIMLSPTLLYMTIASAVWLRESYRDIRDLIKK